MSKRIKQRFTGGRVRTFTSGYPRGSRPNFDVNITSPSKGQHRPTQLFVEFEDNGIYELEFDGRQARTLHDVLSRHFAQVD